MQIRQMIGHAIARDAVTGEVAAALTQRYLAAGQYPNPLALNQQVMFLRTYVGRIADLLDGLRAAARRAGVSARVEPLLESAEHYFCAPLDVISDHVGLVGLVDDAYVCSRLLQIASDRHRATAGVPLLPVDLTAENDFARQLIGEPYASQLDAIVGSASTSVPFDHAVTELGRSQPTLSDTERPWQDDPSVEPGDAAMLSAMLSGRDTRSAQVRTGSEAGTEWRGSAASTLAALKHELGKRSASGEIKESRQQNLGQVLDALEGILQNRAPDLDDSIGQAQQVRDLMGRMLGGIARPSTAQAPAPRGSRLARVQEHIGAIKVYLAAEVMRPNLSEGEHAAVTDLYVRSGHATPALAALETTADPIELEVETLRQLAIDVRNFAARHHLMVIEPIWAAPPGAQDANACFYAGGAAVGSLLAVYCEARRLDLLGQADARRYAEARWEQLVSANVAVFDLTAPAGPELAAVCYELGIALSLGRGIVIVASAGTSVPFDVHIEPIAIDPADPQASLDSALDAAFYGRQFGGGDSALERTLQQLRATLGASANVRVRQMLDLFGSDAAHDPILFRSRLGSLTGFLGSDAPRLATPAWPGSYPDSHRRCFHVMPFGPRWANAVRDCVERACGADARYLRGDQADDARIVRSIWDEICRATHVVVDITDFNPNVALELGIAHTLGRRTLIVAQEGATIERLFRSIAKLRVHPYSMDALEGTLGRIVERFISG